MPYADRRCEICNIFVKGHNYVRHRAAHFRVRSTQAEDTFSDTGDSESPFGKSTSTPQQRCTKKTKSTHLLHVPSGYIDDAVKCMLRRTSEINLPALSRYLAAYFPEIPSEWHIPMITATFSAAHKVSATYVEELLGGDEKRIASAKQSMGRLVHGLSAVEPGRFHHYDIERESGFLSAASSNVDRYSPSNNYLLNRQMPVPLNSNYQQQQLEQEMDGMNADVEDPTSSMLTTEADVLASVVSGQILSMPTFDLGQPPTSAVVISDSYSGSLLVVGSTITDVTAVSNTPIEHQGPISSAALSIAATSEVVDEADRQIESTAVLPMTSLVASSSDVVSGESMIDTIPVSVRTCTTFDAAEKNSVMCGQHETTTTNSNVPPVTGFAASSSGVTDGDTKTNAIPDTVFHCTTSDTPVVAEEDLVSYGRHRTTIISGLPATTSLAASSSDVTVEDTTTSEMSISESSTTAMVSSAEAFEIMRATESVAMPTENPSAVTEDLVSDDVNSGYSFDDLRNSMDVNADVRGLTKPFSVLVTPISTPVHRSEETHEEEGILQLHPSPHPSLEESSSPVKFGGKAHSSKTESKQPESPKKKKKKISSVVASCESKKENLKRSGVQDDEENRKKLKNDRSKPVTSSKSSHQNTDQAHFKTPFKPAQERSAHRSNDRTPPVMTAHIKSKPEDRDRDRHPDHRSRGQSSTTDHRPSDWGRSDRSYHRKSPSSSRMDHLSEKERLWLKQMPPSWRR